MAQEKLYTIQEKLYQEKLYTVKEVDYLLQRFEELGWYYEFLNEEDSVVAYGDILICVPNVGEMMLKEVPVNCWQSKYKFA